MEEQRQSTSWRWWISGLLLLATMINYMDRQTLSNLIPRISSEWNLSNEQYGDMEALFGVTFAIGSLVFGVLADKVSVRLLYPFILVAWSAVGFATGMTQGYLSMMICRGLLGFFESGHWPCALIVTQAVLSKGDRVMGNSILQSGASLGAVLTPLIIRIMIGDSTEENIWRFPFYVIGAVGILWAILWLFAVKSHSLKKTDSNTTAPQGPSVLRWFVSVILDRRFWALLVMVISINTSWQLIRAWLPKFLQEGRGYTEAQALYFNSVYFVFTDVGCIAAGAAALWLTRKGINVHRSRVIVFFVASILAALTTAAAMLPQGWLLLGTLLAVAAGSLGVFPCYYSFTQELSVSHMGRLTGLFSCVGWLASSPMQKLFGYVVDKTGSYDLNIAILGWAPMIGLVGFVLLWPRDHE